MPLRFASRAREPYDFPLTISHRLPLTPMFHVHAWCLPYVATLLGVKQVYPARY